MKRVHGMMAVLICAMVAMTAHGISNSRLEYKLRQYQEQAQADTMRKAMETIGADVSDVTISIRDRGNTLELVGSVTSQEDLDRVNLVVKQYGPYKNERNYVKIKPIEAKDGMVVRLDQLRRVVTAATGTPNTAGATNDCAVCASTDTCEKLYKEREDLIKQLRPMVKRKIGERYVVFDEKAAPLLKRFCEVTSELTASSCYTVEAEPKK